MKKLAIILMAAFLVMPLIANADLVPALGGQVVYDTDLNITWLANANLAATQKFGLGFIGNDGMTWVEAQRWISAMNEANYLSFNDWRLFTSDFCSGYDCTGSEMGHLFYNELGGVAHQPILESSDPDLALFQNVRSFDYWSGTVMEPFSAWMFDASDGGQTYFHQELFQMYAWPVRTGQVAPVPEPSTMLLLGSGLVGLVGYGRRRFKK